MHKKVTECLKSNPNSENPNLGRFNYVLKKSSHGRRFSKLLLGIIRPDDLESNFEETECIKQ